MKSIERVRELLVRMELQLVSVIGDFISMAVSTVLGRIIMIYSSLDLLLNIKILRDERQNK
jgi:hypothetical protein